MCRVYVVSESTPGLDPLKGGPTYFFDSRETLLRFFEPWYTDENHLIIDDQGASWQLVTANDSLDLFYLDQNELLHNTFNDRMRKWLNYSGSTILSKLRFHSHLRNVTFDDALKDKKLLRRISC